MGAEFENTKKRLEKQKQEFAKFANEQLITGLLPVLDNFRSALKNSSENHSLNDILSGIKLIDKQLEDTLKDFGLTAVEAVGRKFDPHCQEAVLHEETDEYDLSEVRQLIGKQVLLTTVAADEKRKVVKLRISDIALTQTYFGDRTLYLPLEKLNKIIYGDQARHIWGTKIKLSVGVDAGLTKPVVRGLWERFAAEQLGPDTDAAGKMWIRTAQENRSEWYAELHKQMGVVMLIFGVICSISVLLIFCIFYMMVETRLKDIAIIKSCGATSSAVAFIFTGFGACVGIIGSGLGIILGIIVTKNVNTIEGWVRVVFGLKLWQASSYMLNTIPNWVNWSGVWPIVIAAILGCCLGALIPAIVAARTKPVDILRYE